MTVLITGGAGYIGSHMVYALLDAGEHAVVVDNLSTGFDWAIPKGVPLVISDSGDQSHIAALIAEHAIDAIIHFAASLIVPDSLRDLLRYYRNNTVNSRALIETARCWDRSFGACNSALRPMAARGKRRPAAPPPLADDLFCRNRWKSTPGARRSC